MEDDEKNQISNTMFEDTTVTNTPKHFKKRKKSNNLSNWPGALGIYSESLKAMKVNGWYILGLLIIGAALSGIINSIFPSTSQNPNLIANLLSIVSNSVIGLLIVYMTFAGINSMKVDVSQSFEAIKKLIAPAIMLSILTWIIYVVSIIALIIPFFIVMPRLVLSLFIMVDQKKDAIESIKESWELTRGQYDKVYGVIGICLLLGLSCLLVITIPFALYFLFMYSASFALLYIYLKNQAK